MCISKTNLKWLFIPPYSPCTEWPLQFSSKLIIK